MPGVTEERLKEVLAANEEANSLEQAARGAVAHQAYAAVLTALTGHWENLPADLENIKAMAERWSRWEDE